MLHGKDAVSRRRKDKSYLRFQCGHPKERVTIYCLDESFIHEEACIFDEMHKGILSRLNPPVIESFTDFAVQCDDSFEKESASGN
jgi:hypothetical protein